MSVLPKAPHPLVVAPEDVMVERLDWTAASPIKSDTKHGSMIKVLVPYSHPAFPGRHDVSLWLRSDMAGGAMPFGLSKGEDSNKVTFKVRWDSPMSAEQSAYFLAKQAIEEDARQQVLLHAADWFGDRTLTREMLEPGRLWFPKAQQQLGYGCTTAHTVESFGAFATSFVDYTNPLEPRNMEDIGVMAGAGHRVRLLEIFEGVMRHAKGYSPLWRLVQVHYLGRDEYRGGAEDSAAGHVTQNAVLFG